MKSIHPDLFGLIVLVSRDEKSSINLSPVTVPELTYSLHAKTTTEEA